MTTRVLEDGDECRHAFSFSILAAHDVARPLGSDEDHVDVCRRNDRLVMDRKAVAEKERLALGQIGLDVFRVSGGLLGVGQSDKNDVCAAHCFRRVEYFKPTLLSDFAGMAFGIKTDDDVHAGFLEIQRVCVSLGAEA